MPDFVFLFMDWLGAVFSILALGNLLYSTPSSSHFALTSLPATQHVFDPLGAVLYIVMYISPSFTALDWDLPIL